MGGRVAEEIVFHDPTTGASNDIEKATSIARKMVTEYGMTTDVGPVKLGHPPARSSWAATWVTAATSGARRGARRPEVRALIEQAHNEAYEVINANRDVLDRLALALLEKETLDHLELADIFSDVEKLPPRPQWLSSEQRPVSAPPAGRCAPSPR